MECQMSTVAQFRILDWGMETCRLKLMVPESSLPDSKQSFSAQVWRLRASHVVDPSRLSWRTRPERAELDTVWTVRSGSTYETNAFHCRSGSVLTIEMACEDPTCNLEVLQYYKNSTTGAYKYLYVHEKRRVSSFHLRPMVRTATNDLSLETRRFELPA